MIPKLKPWLDGCPSQDYWIDGLAAHDGRLDDDCSRCHTRIEVGERVAKVFTVRNPGSSEPKRGMRVGTVCAKCRNDADDRKAAVLGVFENMRSAAKLLGSKGGKSTAAKMTTEQRRARAQNAAAARWTNAKAECHVQGKLSEKAGAALMNVVRSEYAKLTKKGRQR